MKRLFILFCLLSTVLVYGQQTKRALFLGNSYTAYNNLPALVADIAQSLGDSLYHDRNTPGGYTLEGHSTNATSLAKINQGNWDYVVLQEQSQRPAFEAYYVQNDVLPYASQLNDSIKAADSCTQTVFYMTWGRKNGDQINCQFDPVLCTYAGMQGRLRHNYLLMANQNSAIVSPVGIAWRDIRNLNPSIELYVSDGSHPSLAGSYLAACTFYATLFHRSPVGAWHPAGLLTNDADTLQLRAHQAVFDSLSVWNIDTTTLRGSIDGITWQSGLTFLFEGSVYNADTAWWDFGNGSGIHSSDSILYTYPATGVYYIRLYFKRGCELGFVEKELVLSPGYISLKESQADFVTVSHYNGFLHIELQQSHSTQLKIWSLNGQKVLEQMLHSTQSKVALNSLQKGVYIVSLQQGLQFHSQKIIVIE